MPEGSIKVTPRTLPDGIDIERLALALVELVRDLPEPHRLRLAVKGSALLADAEAEVGGQPSEGVA
jgi:hypothetical protein